MPVLSREIADQLGPSRADTSILTVGDASLGKMERRSALAAIIAAAGCVVRN
jgi:hypothetical protein